MRIIKIFTPLDRAAKALFKDTIGNDVGEKYYGLSYKEKGDLFVQNNTKPKTPCKVTSKQRRKW